MRVVPTHLRKNDVGNVFGRLKIIGEPFYLGVGKTNRTRAAAVCECECGGFFCALLKDLGCGNTSSCGCARGPGKSKSRLPRKTLTCPTCGVEFTTHASKKKTYCSRKCIPWYTQHGMSDSRIYDVWHAMRSRCNNSARADWMHYGGRGISICDEWSSSFTAFQSWSESSGYKSGLELDRIDVNGNYCPGNCRWVTRSQQTINTRKRRDGVSSRFKGVARIGSGRWSAQINCNNQRYYLGSFDTQEEAALAYNKAALELFGEYAHLNQIDMEVQSVSANPAA